MIEKKTNIFINFYKGTYTEGTIIFVDMLVFSPRIFR